MPVGQVNLLKQVKMANYFATIKIFKKQTVDSATQTDPRPNPYVKSLLKDKKIHQNSPIPIHEDEALIQIERLRITKRIDQLCKKVAALSSSIGVSWFKALESEFSKPYFRRISFYLNKERKLHTVYPVHDLIYNWTTKCGIQDVKVVILGRQPSHLDIHSNGLAYSVVKGYLCSESALNIYKELRSDFPEFKIPTHGDLSGWAYQGVLLLNVRLTVRAQHMSAHKVICWETFTDAVIEWINNNLYGVVFLLWGTDLQEKADLLDKTRHYILMAAHPSPKTANKGFFGCKHFSKTNEILMRDGRTPINWSDL